MYYRNLYLRAEIHQKKHRRFRLVAAEPKNGGGVEFHLARPQRWIEWQAAFSKIRDEFGVPDAHSKAWPGHTDEETVLDALAKVVPEHSLKRFCIAVPCNECGDLIGVNGKAYPILIDAKGT